MVSFIIGLAVAQYLPSSKFCKERIPFMKSKYWNPIHNPFLIFMGRANIAMGLQL